ncbi:unnamed protein product, partial [Didymodactylos carnosus]
MNTDTGCYHAAEVLLYVQQLYEQTGIFIRHMDFSDPQSGKASSIANGKEYKEYNVLTSVLLQYRLSRQYKYATWRKEGSDEREGG